MSPPDSDISIAGLLLSIGAFTLTLLILAGLTYLYLYRAHTPRARKVTYAALLLSGSSVFLAFLYALSPRLLTVFPFVGSILVLVCLFTYFGSRFCPKCGRPTPRYRLFLQFTNCPYCGATYDEPPPNGGD